MINLHMRFPGLRALIPAKYFETFFPFFSRLVRKSPEPMFAAPDNAMLAIPQGLCWISNLTFLFLRALIEATTWPGLHLIVFSSGPALVPAEVQRILLSMTVRKPGVNTSLEGCSFETGSVSFSAPLV